MNTIPVSLRIEKNLLDSFDRVANKQNFHRAEAIREAMRLFCQKQKDYVDKSALKDLIHGIMADKNLEEGYVPIYVICEKARAKNISNSNEKLVDVIYSLSQELHLPIIHGKLYKREALNKLERSFRAFIAENNSNIIDLKELMKFDDTLVHALLTHPLSNSHEAGVIERYHNILRDYNSRTHTLDDTFPLFKNIPRKYDSPENVYMSRFSILHGKLSKNMWKSSFKNKVVAFRCKNCKKTSS